MRRRHILNVDPFLVDKGYIHVREAVRSAVEGDVKQLSSIGAAQKSNPKIKKYLMQAIFQEVAFLS